MRGQRDRAQLEVLGLLVVAVGGSGEEDWRVDQIMQVLGDATVMWPTAKTNLDSGAYANANMAPFYEPPAF